MDGPEEPAGNLEDAGAVLDSPAANASAGSPRQQGGEDEAPSLANGLEEGMNQDALQGSEQQAGMESLNADVEAAQPEAQLDAERNGDYDAASSPEVEHSEPPGATEQGEDQIAEAQGDSYEPVAADAAEAAPAADGDGEAAGADNGAGASGTAEGDADNGGGSGEEAFSEPEPTAAAEPEEAAEPAADANASGAAEGDGGGSGGSGEEAFSDPEPTAAAEPEEAAEPAADSNGLAATTSDDRYSPPLSQHSSNGGAAVYDAAAAEGLVNDVAAADGDAAAYQQPSSGSNGYQDEEPQPAGTDEPQEEIQPPATEAHGGEEGYVEPYNGASAVQLQEEQDEAPAAEQPEGSESHEREPTADEAPADLQQGEVADDDEAAAAEPPGLEDGAGSAAAAEESDPWVVAATDLVDGAGESEGEGDAAVGAAEGQPRIDGAYADADADADNNGDVAAAQPEEAELAQQPEEAELAQQPEEAELAQASTQESSQESEPADAAAEAPPTQSDEQRAEPASYNSSSNNYGEEPFEPESPPLAPHMPNVAPSGAYGAEEQPHDGEQPAQGGGGGVGEQAHDATGAQLQEQLQDMEQQEEEAVSSYESPQRAQPHGAAPGYAHTTAEPWAEPEPEEDGAAPPSGDPARAITQRYLELLRSGNLAPAAMMPKPSNAAKEAWPEGRSPKASTTAAGDAAADGGGLSASPSAVSATSSSSVHAAELARLQAGLGRDVSPIKRSATNSYGHGHGLPPLLPTGSPTSKRPQSPPWKPLREVPSRVFSPRHVASAAPYQKLYTPGPGAYTPVTRSGGSPGVIGAATNGFTSRSWTFGSSQRPASICPGAVSDASPGPVYLPTRNCLSTSTRTTTYVFDRQLRSAGEGDPHIGFPSNTPHWNPAPGQYNPSVTAAGERLDPGKSVPAHSFSRTRKLLAPETDGAALPIISKVHVREYLGTLGPGPGHYSPHESCTRQAAAAYTAGGKAPSYFDAAVAHGAQASPGPIYHPGDVDRRGKHSLGDGPRATVGLAPKAYDPLRNGLAATPFISKDHARINHGVLSPGPVYLPHVVRTGQERVSTPVLGSGQRDRFAAGLAEPGRLQ